MGFYGAFIGGNFLRARSRSTCKHKHSIEYMHHPRRRCTSVFDDYPDDNESDCDCGDCGSVRGRRRRRNAPLVEVNAFEGCRGRCRSRSHSRPNMIIISRSRSRNQSRRSNHSRSRSETQGGSHSRSHDRSRSGSGRCSGSGICSGSGSHSESRSSPRSITSGYDSDDDDSFYPFMRGPSSIPGLQQTPRHRDGRCCIHGASWLVSCGSCTGRISRYLPDAGPRYRLFQNDDGKVEVFDTGVLLEKAKATIEEAERADREKKQGKEKKLKKDIENMKRLLDSHQGYAWPPHAYRSANDIRKDLMQVNTDLKQCRSRATAVALMNGAINEREVRRDFTDYDGLLEIDDEVVRVPVENIKVLKSILKDEGRKSLRYVEIAREDLGARVEEVTDE